MIRVFSFDPYRCNSLIVNESHFIPADHPRGQSACFRLPGSYSRAGLGVENFRDPLWRLVYGKFRRCRANARRELAFGKGCSCLHIIALFLIAGLGFWPWIIHAFSPDPYRCNLHIINESHFVPADQPRGQSVCCRLSVSYSHAGFC